MNGKELNLDPGIPRDQVRGLLHELRGAVGAALADAESYMPLVHSFERIGRHLRHLKLGAPDRELTLGGMGSELFGIALGSSLEPERLRALFELILDARNHAVHQGAAARQLRSWAVNYALALQEGLMANLKDVRAEDVMVPGVVVAQPWHLLRDVRTTMLANSFSWIPVRLDHRWWLLQDLAIARLLLNVVSAERRAALNRRVEDARGLLRPARTIGPAVRRAELPLSDDPLLVVDLDDRLLGITTAYDLL